MSAAPPVEDWQRAGWMQTYTGRQFRPLHPQPADIDPRDIAHALSMLCRYGSHTDRFYSVAEHCVLMSWAVPPEHRLAALLHDATEAYVGDMVRPLKRSLPAYEQIEAGVWWAVAERFGAPIELPASVKEADNRILLTERDALMSARPPATWDVEGMTPLPVTVTGWAPRVAEQQYLAALSECWQDPWASDGGDAR